jgi:hypothetical protein
MSAPKLVRLTPEQTDRLRSRLVGELRSAGEAGSTVPQLLKKVKKGFGRAGLNHEHMRRHLKALAAAREVRSTGKTAGVVRWFVVQEKRSPRPKLKTFQNRHIEPTLEYLKDGVLIVRWRGATAALVAEE